MADAKKDERNQERIVGAIQKLRDAGKLLADTDPGEAGEEAGNLIDEANTLLEEVESTMPTYTVYAQRIDIVRMETTIEAVDRHRAWEIARELDENNDSLDFISADSPDGLEIIAIVEKRED